MEIWSTNQGPFLQPSLFIPKKLRGVVLVNGEVLKGCYGEGNLHSLAEMTMLGEVVIIASGGVDVTDLVMEYTSMTTFTTPSLPLSSDCFNLCVKPLSLPPYLPPSMTLKKSR